ncbi:MAG: cysteine--tRNA ligase [Candidatus Margulisiibacteriota bacterium]
MGLCVYNTLSRKEEPFVPAKAPDVSMYVCGITPYDETHLGHGRAYAAFDVIRRYLEYSGYRVNYVQNITDIDDKIIEKANRLGKTIEEVSDTYTKSFFEVMDKLKIKKAAQYPKATENIQGIVDLIAGLVSSGHAYQSGGDVYFDISKDPAYGKLSGRDLEGMQAGARVEVSGKKKNPLDFVLWKAAKENEPYWDSPWGKGRPGWHSECVVMSRKYLGERIDIHGGGADLIFPHHENEIAQAECCGKGDFVKYWLHNGFITINKEKMSKSLGNFFTLSELFKQFDPMAVRFFLIRSHYRSPINFSPDGIKEAASALEGIKNAYEDMAFMLRSSKNDRSSVKIDVENYKLKFISAMDRDFNTPEALAAVFDLIRAYNENRFKLSTEDINNIRLQLEEFNNVMEFGIKEKKAEVKDNINDLVAQRTAAKKEKDFKLADKLRAEIEAKGYIIEDTPFGSFVKKKPDGAISGPDTKVSAPWGKKTGAEPSGSGKK